MKRGILTVAGFLAALAPLQTAQAFDDNELYVSLSGGVSFLQDSENSGAFVGDFVTGEGTTIPAGTVLPNGTGVGWTTEFDTGFTVAGAVGMRFLDAFRGEIEVAYQSNDVDTHSGVTAGGIGLDAEDAGVLITGSGNLGTSVGNLVADGQGSVDTLFVMANAYFDFGDDSWIAKPYIGAGLGFGIVEVDYSPSNTLIVDDTDTRFAYQVMAGLSAPILPNADLFGGYRYRATEDAETDVALFNAGLDIENASHIVEAGIRFRFN